MKDDHVIVMKNEENVLRHFLHARTMKQNRNAIIIISGPTGSGKSYIGLAIGESMAKKNNVEFDNRHITFTGGEFLRLINSGILKRGSIILLDEAGVAASSQDWYSLVNKALKRVVQTYRHENYITIMCVPDLSFIDKNLKKMSHIWLKTAGINYQTKTAYAKCYVWQHDQESGNAYKRFFIKKVYGKPPKRICRALPFRKPEDEVVKRYEQRKKQYTDALNKQLEKELNIVDDGSTIELTPNQKLALTLRNDFSLKQEDIAKIMTWESDGVWNQGQVHATLKGCKKKGHIVNRPSLNKKIVYSDDDLKKILKEAKISMENKGGSGEEKNKTGV